MKLSHFGHQLSSDSGIVSLMEDLGHALNVNPDLLFLGGGNPARVPAFETAVAEHLQRIARDPAALHKLIGVYQSPQGSETFIAALASYLRQQLGWPVKAQNIALTNGSQSAFFMLINMLAGERQAGEGGARQFVFPMMPEYLGYADQGIAEGMFRGFLPKIEHIDQHSFKYHVDFSALHLPQHTAALCVSRPTNPTGNVLTDAEIERLAALAKANNTHLIVDCAYGAPFPGIIYQGAHSAWSEHMIYVLSLSKLGLPGARTGIVIAREDLIEQLVKINTIISLANGNLGPSLMGSLLASGELPGLCSQSLLPFYRAKRDFAVACVHKHLAGLGYHLHRAEGAFFVWLWFENLPISSGELYQRMKQRGVLIMDGAHFFFGLDKQWPHAQQCVRLSYCQDEAVIDAALRILGDELRAIYG